MIPRELIPNPPQRNSDNWAFDYYNFNNIKTKYQVKGGHSLSGNGIKIAIIDSGYSSVYDEGELEGRIAPKNSVDLNHYSCNINLFINSPVAKIIEKMLEDNDGIPEVTIDKNNGHGTRIASLIGGINGICPKSEIAIINAYDSKDKNDNLVSLGIYWAIAHGFNLVNISLDIDYCSISLHKAIMYAYRKDVILICSAGNDSFDDLINLPASFQKTLAVGGFNIELKPWGSKGRLVDFNAPAKDLRINSVNTTEYNGTSYSCAFITSMLGLFYEKWKDIKRGDNRVIEYSMLKEILINTSYKPNNNDSRLKTGYGILHPKILFSVFDNKKIEIILDESQISKISQYLKKKANEKLTISINYLELLKQLKNYDD